MSDSAPPIWIRRLPKAGSGLDAAHKFMLITLWAWGLYAVKRGSKCDRPDLDKEIRPDAPIVVYPARSRLVTETGQPLGTVKSQLARLAELGWIERGRSSNMVLAWRWPRNFDASRPTGQPPWLTHQPADTPADPADSSATPADTPADPRLTHQPLTCSELPIEPSTNVVEARDLDAYGIPARTADEAAAVYGPRHDPAPTPPPVDPWPGRVREASPGAHYLLDITSTSTSDKSYCALMRQARANYGDERVLEALRIHESDAPEHRRGRPPGKKIWHSTWAPWVERVLGIEAPAPASRPATKRSPNGQAAFEAVMAKVEARRLEVVS
jgi:hypothetical protein